MLACSFRNRLNCLRQFNSFKYNFDKKHLMIINDFSNESEPKRSKYIY